MSAGRKLYAGIQAELDELTSRQILTPGQSAPLKERYPTTPWDILPLVRIFTVLGVLTAMTGTVILVKDMLDFWLLSELGLLGTVVGFIALGRWLKLSKGMPLLGESLELAGGMALQGLTIVLAIHYSTGSKNWPSLVGVDAALLVGLAYALANPLVLWYACANLFFFLGAETGYLSDWGAYYLGMTYPVRYLAIAVVTLGLAYVHAVGLRGRWVRFSRVYAHYGLLIANMAMWFMSLFGYYEDIDQIWSGRGSERLVFSILWFGLSVLSMVVSSKTGWKLLRKYAFTFLVINLYTFYFQFVVANSGEAWFLHLLLTGGSLVGLGIFLERRRKHGKIAEPE
ncbi:MAG TPA: hypothetical protein PLQ54_11495 [Armatimonadota bacterium]|nr:hypothetical protein [Armatimonadota bacterium]